MNIAVFHNLTPGGAKRTVFEQVKGLSKNHSVHLFEIVPQDRTYLDPSNYSEKNSEYIFRSDNNFPGMFNRLIRDHNSFFKLKRLHKQIANDINNGGYDVCLVHPDIYTESPYLLNYLKTPSVYFCHELLRIAYEKELKFSEDVIFYKKLYEDFTRNIRKVLDRRNARCADKIVTNSKFIRKNIIKYYGRNATVCKLGVDCRIFKPYKAKKSQMLFIGNKTKAEGYLLLKYSLKLIPKNKQPKLKILYFKKDIPKIRNDEKLAKEYSRSIATLCLDYNEPFGLKALESMACGTPVIAVEEGGYKESVLNGRTGIFISRNPVSLAKAILNLSNNPKVVRNMGSKGRKYVCDKWQWSSHIIKLERILKDVGKASL